MTIPQTETIDAAAMATLSPESGKRRAINDADVTWFSSQLTGTGSSGLPNTLQPNPPTGNASLGDIVLNGLRGAGTDLHEQWKNVTNGLTTVGPAPSIAEMLRLQIDVVTLVHHTEIASTVIKKVSGAVDQLVHTQ